MPFTMDVEKQGEVVVIRPHGRITELEAHELNAELLDQIHEGARRLVMDLNDVAFMSSSGLGAFMSAHKRGRSLGVVILLANLQPLVRDVISATKLHKLFPVFDTLEQALAAP